MTEFLFNGNAGLLNARRVRDQLEPIIGPSGGGTEGQSVGPSRPSIIEGKYLLEFYGIFRSTLEDYIWVNL